MRAAGPAMYEETTMYKTKSSLIIRRIYKTRRTMFTISAKDNFITLPKNHLAGFAQRLQVAGMHA
jgi:archaeosine-15-forming tRNA-guanine transglycosylase